jgi:hypothetical protein
MIPHPNTHPDLAAALDFLHDALTEAELIHAQEQDEDNPNLWTVAVRDDDGYDNVGFVAWSDKTGKVEFIAHNPVIVNHDKGEDVPEEDCKGWWDCRSADNMLLHLMGEVRRIMAKTHRIELAKQSA